MARFLVLLAVLLASSQAAEDPGVVAIIDDHTNSLFHEKFLLGMKFSETVNNTELPKISGSLATILWSRMNFELDDLQVKEYDPLEADVKTTEMDGMILTVLLPMIRLEAKYNMTYKINESLQSNFTGQLSITFHQLTLKILKALTMQDDGKKLLLESVNCTCSIENIEVELNNEVANEMFALVDTNQLYQYVDDLICFEKFYKNLTEWTHDYYFNISDIFYWDLTVVTTPEIHDGFIKVELKGVVKHKGDDREFKGTSPEFLDLNPNSTVAIQVSTIPFDSLSEAIHNNDVLSGEYKQINLPDGSNFLDITCDADKDCFGNLFEETKKRYPDFQARINVSTIKAPRVFIDPSSLKFQVEFKIEVGADKKDNDDKADLFTIQVSMMVPFELSVKIGKVVFKIQQAEYVNITTIDSKIGDLEQKGLQILSEQVLQQNLYPGLASASIDGVDLQLGERFYIANYMVEPKNNYVELLLGVSYKEEGEIPFPRKLN